MKRALLIASVLISAVANGHTMNSDDPRLELFWQQCDKKWTFQNQSRQIMLHCKTFAKEIDPTIIKPMISDVLQHPATGEVREMMYTWVIFYMDRTRSHPILQNLDKSGNKAEKKITGGMLYDLDELDTNKSEMP